MKNERIELTNKQNKILKVMLDDLRRLCDKKEISLTNDDDSDYKLLERAIITLQIKINSDELIIL